MGVIDRERLQANLLRLQKELHDADQALADNLRTIAEKADRDRATYCKQVEDLDREEQQEIQRHTDAMIELRRLRDTYTAEFNLSLADASAKMREIIAPPSAAARLSGPAMQQAAE